jgi:hypothetical protein
MIRDSTLTDKAKNKLQDFLAKLFNNNEPGYFYLDSAGTVLEMDCCAVLGVSIALKASEHYETCANAKLLQLTDTFQAKLGWLVGQMYSRVGTLDWPVSELKPKISSVLDSSVILVPFNAEKALKQEFDLQAKQQADVQFSADQISAIIKGLPSNKQQVLARVDAVINQVLSPDLINQDVETMGKTVGRIMRRLDGDAAFTQLTK